MQDTPLEPQTNPSGSQSILFGSFSLLRSPLFIVVTILIGSIAYLVFRYTGKLEVSILLGVMMELLALIIIFQYLMLSRRLEDITHRSAELQARSLDIEHKLNSSKSAHGFTHRLIRTMSGDQSKLLQSSEELKRATRLFHGLLEDFYSHIERIQNQYLEDLGKLSQSLDQLKNDTIEGWQNKNLENFGEITQSLDNLQSKTLQEWQNQNLQNFGEITQSLDSLKSETLQEWQNQNLQNFGEITQSLDTLKNETLQEWQKLNLQNFGEITQSLDSLKSETLQEWQKQNLQNFDEVTQTLATFKSETIDELGQTRESLRDSGQKSLSEVSSGLITLARDIEARQKKGFEQFVTRQNSDFLKKTNTARTKLKTNMATHVDKSLSKLRENLAKDLPAKTASVFNERLAEQSHEIIATYTKLDEKFTELRDHLSTIEGEINGFTERENNISKALEVSTALDRLNLEVRRQLAELRLELNDQKPA
jgi:hypothetical protein